MMNLPKIFLLCVLLAAIAVSGCKKKKTPVGNVPVPTIPDKIDLLPSVINVKYHEGTSGVESCKTCHSQIHNEWSQSFHSRATTSKLFKKMSDDYNFEGCVSCHAPHKPTFTDERPKARTWKVHEGVTCSSCHVVGNRTVGSLGSNAPHKVHKDIRIVDSVACASCHQETHKQWEKSKYKEQGISCQSCHMPLVKRYISDLPKNLYTKKDSRKHTFEIDFTEVVKMELSQSRLIDDQITLKVTNIGAGHALPTGHYGDTSVFLEFQVLDGDKVIYFREEQLSALKENQIMPGQTRSFFYRFKAPAKKSYLMVAKAIFNSSNYAEDIKLAQVEQYFYPKKEERKLLLTN